MPEWFVLVLKGTGLFLSACVFAGWFQPSAFRELAKYALILTWGAVFGVQLMQIAITMKLDGDLLWLWFVYFAGLSVAIMCLIGISSVLSEHRRVEEKEKYRENYYNKSLERIKRDRSE